MMIDFLGGLNESQLEAVVHGNGPLFVVAGAGTGKTRTLTTRIAYLIHSGVEANRILAVTFTNKAAREMKERVIDMVGPHATGVWLYTFHGFGLQFLRKHIAELPYGYRPNFTVIDEEDGKKIIVEQAKVLEIDIKKYSPRVVKNLISLYKCNRLPMFERIDEERLYTAYQKYLMANQLVDFDDLLIYTHELLRDYQDIRDYYQMYFQHVLVDEFQDTDVIQYKILSILGKKHKNIFVVGDPDQSIYSFRGANYQNAAYFLKEFEAEQVLLEKNYRSTNKILAAANKLISYNINRPAPKTLESDLGQGEPITYFVAENDMQEVYYVVNQIQNLQHRGIDYDDIIVLYRNNALSRIFEDTLMKANIPYIIYGGISFYERKEIKDILAYLRTALNPQLDFYLKRIINEPRRQIGNITVQKIDDIARIRNISFFEAIDYFEGSGTTKANLLQFKELIYTIQKELDEMVSLEQVVPFLMHQTGYLKMLQDDQNELSDDRIENLKELITVFVRGEEYYEGTLKERLNQLLDQIALYSNQDQVADDRSKVRLSTFHQAKGLEFKIVFMVCLEEGLFPNERSMMTAFELEEERRVCYVGMTRAKEKLYMTYSKRRLIYGSLRLNIPSRFVLEAKVQAEAPSTYDAGEETRSVLKVGDHVSHPTFNKGVVVAIEAEIATIAFEFPHGIKKILESHPTLKKIKK